MKGVYIQYKSLLFMKLYGLRNFVTTVLGLIMVLAPLALWVAWSEKIFLGILLIFGLAFCFLTLIDTVELGQGHR